MVRVQGRHACAHVSGSSQRLKPDGKTPTILYGYGGFNVSLTPEFNSDAAWWVEQGGVYAVANLRGRLGVW